MPTHGTNIDYTTVTIQLQKCNNTGPRTESHINDVIVNNVNVFKGFAYDMKDFHPLIHRLSSQL